MSARRWRTRRRWPLPLPPRRRARLPPPKRRKARPGLPGGGGAARGARTEKELDYQRRRRRVRQAKQKRAATLLARGISKTAAAAAVGVSPRTLHNWKSTPSFSRELERQRKHLDQHAVPRPRRTRRQSQRTSVPKRELAPPEPKAAAASGPPPAQRPSAAAESLAAIEARRLDSYENYLDSNQARRGQLTPAEIRALKPTTDET